MSARHRKLNRERYYVAQINSWVEQNPNFDDPEDFDDDSRCCHFCGGDGCVYGEDYDDPDMYDQGKIYSCKCCGGSGKAEDCTWW